MYIFNLLIVTYVIVLYIFSYSINTMFFYFLYFCIGTYVVFEYNIVSAVVFKQYYKLLHLELTMFLILIHYVYIVKSYTIRCVDSIYFTKCLYGITNNVNQLLLLNFTYVYFKRQLLVTLLFKCTCIVNTFSTLLRYNSPIVQTISVINF